MENRHRSFLYSILPTIAILGLQMVSILFLSQIAMVKATVDFTGSTFNEYIESIMTYIQGTDFSVWASFMYSFLGTIVFAFWYRALRRQGSHDFKADLNEAAEKLREAGEEAKGVFFGCKWTMIPGVVVFIFGLQFVCVYLVEFLGRLFPEWLALYDQILKSSGLEDMSLSVPLVLYAAIFGPLVEELAFRGVTYSYARRAMPLWAANIIQAVLFAGMHMNPIQSAYALLFGLLLGYIYGKSRNIAITGIIHICFNTVSLLCEDLFVTGSDAISFFLILLTSLMATYFGFLLIIRSLPVAIRVNPKDEY